MAFGLVSRGTDSDSVMVGFIKNNLWCAKAETMGFRIRFKPFVHDMMAG